MRRRRAIFSASAVASPTPRTARGVAAFAAIAAVAVRMQSSASGTFAHRLVRSRTHQPARGRSGSPAPVAAPLHALLLAAALAAVAGCATRAPAPALPPIAGDARAHQQSRETALAAQPVWSLGGRVAVSNGREGGSGRIDWSQDGARYAVQLSAPVTRQSWRLRGEPGGPVVLEGLDGGPRQGSDAQALVREATRWDIPVDALASWVRGVAAEPGRHGPAELAFGGDGRLSGLEQDGWRIAYADWRPAPGGGFELPYRLEATRGEARVRLVVDQWQPPE